MTLHVRPTRQSSRADAAHQLAFSEFLRRAMRTCADLQAPKQGPVFGKVFEELASLVHADAIVTWERSLDRSWSREASWVGNDAARVDSLAATIGPYGDRAETWSNLSAPVVIEVDEARTDIHVVGHTGAPETTHLLVPAETDGQVVGALTVSRARDLSWLPHEIAGCAELADILWKTRHRLAVGAQLAPRFHEAPLGVTLRSSDGTLIDCNQAFAAFLGLESEASLLRVKERDLLAPEELTQEMLDHYDEPASQRSRPLELPYRHRSGTVVWGRLSLSPVRCDDIELWLTHVEDVTKKRSERVIYADPATLDPLTGLITRHALLDRLSQDLARPDAEQGAATNAVVLLSIDGLVEVNDRFGRHAGDHVLRTIGDQLGATLGPADLLARSGGNEFVVVFDGPTTHVEATSHAEALRAALIAPVEINDEPVLLGVAVGTAVGLPGMSAADVLMLASAAMHDDKANAD